MPEEKSQDWYSWVEGQAFEYGDSKMRTAVIAGFFNGMPKDTVFTAAQVSQMLAIRNLVTKKERPCEPASSGALE